jgi:CRISPR-associated protein Csd1
MKIDPMISNIGYRLGRLFAVLEKIETEADPGVESTIHNRHYGMAVSRPVTIFQALINESKEKLEKIKDDDMRDKLKGLLLYLTDELHSIPLYLNNPDQTMFMQAFDRQNQNFREGIYD